MRSTLILTAAAIALRWGLFAGGVHVEVYQFAPAHLLFLVLVAYFNGFFTLREDKETGFAELLRSGLRETTLYALMIAVFTWFFFTYINDMEFPTRIEAMVKGSVAEGHAEAEVRERIGHFFTPGWYAFLSFMGLMASGAINALIFAYVHHKWLRRFMQ